MIAPTRFPASDRALHIPQGDAPRWPVSGLVEQLASPSQLLWAISGCEDAGDGALFTRAMSTYRCGGSSG